MNAQSKVYLKALTTFVRTATAAVCYFSALTALGKPRSMADSLERLISIFPGPDDMKPPSNGKGDEAETNFYGQLKDEYEWLYTQLCGMFLLFCGDLECYPPTSEQITSTPKRFQDLAQTSLTASVNQATEATIRALSDVALGARSMSSQEPIQAICTGACVVFTKTGCISQPFDQTTFVPSQFD